MGAFYAFATTDFFKTRLFEPYLAANAEFAGAVLPLLGESHVHVRGAYVESLAFALQVSRGCDGTEPIALFAALILAFPAPARRKLRALALGVPALVVLNLVRVLSLFLIGVYAPTLFHVMHVDVWQLAFILAAVGLWAAWLGRAAVTGPPPADA